MITPNTHNVIYESISICTCWNWEKAFLSIPLCIVGYSSAERFAGFGRVCVCVYMCGGVCVCVGGDVALREDYLKEGGKTQ